MIASSPKAALDGLDEGIRNAIIHVLQEVQGGKCGPPTLDDLNRCGEYHAFLERGGTVSSVLKDHLT